MARAVRRLQPQSAVLVPLDPAVTRYAWRAYTVAEDDDHYVVGDWIRFTMSRRADVGTVQG